MSVHPPTSVLSEVSLEAPTTSPRLPKPVLMRPAPLGTSNAPLFCFGGAGADEQIFEDIVRELAPVRSVYACCFLDDGGPAVGNWAHRSVDSLAAELIEQIREIQPQGPYFLCGYSLGARLIFIMARELRRVGHEVGMVALLDGWGPGFPLRYSAGRRMLIHVRNLFGPGAFRYLQGRLIRVRHRLIRLIARRIQSVTGKDTAAWGSQLPGRPARLSIVAPPTYRPQPYDGDIVFIRADIMPDWPGSDFSDRACGWTPFVRGKIDIRPVQCQHLELLYEPAAREVADILDNCMRTTATKADRASAH